MGTPRLPAPRCRDEAIPCGARRRRYGFTASRVRAGMVRTGVTARRVQTDTRQTNPGYIARF
ncbi:hypothetical protein OH687_35895 [Burkholderia anthina]|nr:hypothetical protein OH687_35895 [Burkholderia anthina]